MNMVERVARAIHMSTVLRTGQWNKLNLTEQESYFVAARVAIQAMREPTEEMIKARDDFCFCHDYGTSDNCYIAMIDAALKE